MKLAMWLKHLIVVSIAFTLIGCDDMKSEKKCVAFVDMQHLIQSSSMAEKEKSHLDDVNHVLMKGSADAESRYGSMDKKAAEKARKADSEILLRQWAIEQRAARLVVFNAIKIAAEAVREKEGYTAILDSATPGVWAFKDSKNVTEKMADILKETVVVFPDLPVVSKKQDEKS